MSNVNNTLNVADQVRTQFSDRNGQPIQADMLPLFGPENSRTGIYGLFRSDDGQFIGRSSVTGGYKPHLLSDVVALVEAATTSMEWENAQVKCHWNQGHWVSLAPSREHRVSIFGTKDDIWQRLLINAGYSGKAFQVDLGMYRDACKNMSIPRMVEGISRKVKHTDSLDSKVQTLIEELRDLKHGWNNIVAEMRTMAERRVNVRELLNEIYPAPANDASRRSHTIAENRWEAILTRLVRESQQFRQEIPSRANKFMANGWLAYNAIQGYVQHDQSRKGNPSQFDRMILAQESTEVARAEQLILAA